MGFNSGFKGLSETFVFLLQHSLQLIYSWTKNLPQRWKQKKHPQYQSWCYNSTKLS